MKNYNFACVIREDPALAALFAVERRNSNVKPSLLNKVVVQIPYLDVDFSPNPGIILSNLFGFCHFD